LAVNYYSLGSFVANKTPIIGKWYPIIGTLLTHHGFICFMLMIIGFLGFVLSLKQGYLKYQFRLFGWIVVRLFLTKIHLKAIFFLQKIIKNVGFVRSLPYTEKYIF